MKPIDQLIQAVEQGDAGQVNALLQSDPDLSSARHPNGVSLLLWALYYGQKEIALRLAENRIDLDVFDASSLGAMQRLAGLLQDDRSLANAWSADGFQPLGLTCFFQQPAAARLLIEFGADISSPSKNNARVQPLHSAAASDQVEIVRLLLRKGAKVNARQAGDFTPIHSAAQNGNLEMLNLLLAYGADPSFQNSEGLTPLDYAVKGGHSAIVERLQAVEKSSRRIILNPSNPDWPVFFRKEAASLLKIFEPLLGAIYHIGSTSVPGLRAKPTLDILVEVTDLLAVDALNQEMEGMGYEARGEQGIPGRCYFVRQENNIHQGHVHVFQTGNSEIKRHLAFRDYLRRHPDMAEAYGDLKEELAVQFLRAPEAYTSGKEKFVRQIDRLAAEEDLLK